ncbi:MAG: 5-oxoprolinase subunit PxpB [Xanthomonadales bacterium]|nr:5-oxoprolinase subunit PxpB [Xanthomonadales bacterium]
MAGITTPQTHAPRDVRIEPIADDAWRVVFGSAIDDATLARVHALAARLAAHRLPGVVDIVPAYASLGVHVDLLQIDADEAVAWIRGALAGLDSAHTAAPAREVEIPVAYGGAFGPDLIESAALLGLDADALVARHASVVYTVAMIGFAPGFPYLIGLPEALALPRLASPRTRIPAGSVGIGGAQTGIYPRESPGGWRILGRTPSVLFDPQRDPPALLQPGDRVRFVPIDADAFARLSKAAT